MISNSKPSISLPAEAKAVIWRIFGDGESPLKKLSTYELIEPIIRKHVPPTEQDRAVTDICGWFESHGDRQWLKSDMSEPVAELIVEGIGTERTERRIWAVGSIGTDLTARIIHSRWSPDEIDSFVEATLTTLKKPCDIDEVLDATRCTIFEKQESFHAKIPKSAVERKGKLESFRHLDNHGSELVHQGLYPAVGNLIELVIELRPEIFEPLIKRLDHPVMRARAAHHMITKVRPMDHRKTLLWITKDACDSLIALAIMHTLNTVNRLDENIRCADHLDINQFTWSTELRPPQDNLDTAASDLLTGLVDRLALRDPLECVQWIGEMLSNAPCVLNHIGDSGEKPQRVEQLETVCTERLACLVRQYWSNDLLVEFCAGLSLTPRTTWTRHLAEIAWAIHDTEPALAVEIARTTLEKHEQHVADEIEHNRLFQNWNDWHYREWIAGLGTVLALSGPDIDLLELVSEQCRALPLSVWDAEKDIWTFRTADRAAQHWFLVALHAIPQLQELGHMVDPAEVSTLNEAIEAHCRFVNQYLCSRPTVSVVEKIADHLVREFGGHAQNLSNQDEPPLSGTAHGSPPT